MFQSSSKVKEYTLDDGYVSFASDQTKLKNITKIDDIMKLSCIPDGFEKHKKVIETNSYSNKKKKKKEEPVELSEEIENDIKVLQMRSVLDKKRFYKKNDIKLSKDIKIGRVLDNPADFYSSRIPNKLRKRTLVDELLNDAKFKKEIKKSYAKIVSEQRFTSHNKYKKWKKKFYKNQNKSSE
ncbi:hypothetical protein O3M35_003316 [Rhynocoris fuscipes]|uniref:Fcf2 pre-rRNA processing C-terminal domain-containing protein n=1 Tax=Rhynocoris fuscipes TaxID=488301 RepID=A0AAW1CJY8_9HEMI